MIVRLDRSQRICVGKLSIYSGSPCIPLRKSSDSAISGIETLRIGRVSSTERLRNLGNLSLEKEPGISTGVIATRREVRLFQ